MAAFFPLATACAPTPANVDRPNIVLIVGDDHGFTDSGFMGHAIVKTPHLDRLAAEGTVFTHGYSAASTCRPSLLALLTGLQPYQVERRAKQLERFGTPRREANRILDFRTLPGLLSQRGYQSYQVGKHWEAMATDAGFTGGTKSGALEGGRLGRSSGGRVGLDVGRTTMAPVWKFLDSVGSEPFLLWFAPLLPHAPMDAPEQFLERYQGHDLSTSALAYYANVSRLDDAIGALIDHLEQLGVLEQTLIVYVSDNGWDQEPTADYRAARGGKLGGFRGKMSMHEKGFRTPIVFRWPGQVPSGVSTDALVSLLDVFPTLLDYAGLTAPAGREGLSLRPTIEQVAAPPSRTLFGWMAEALPDAVGDDANDWMSKRQPATFARTKRWHYFAFEGGAPGRSSEEHLYDMLADPMELANVAQRNRDTVRGFRQSVRRWKREKDRSLPSRGGRGNEWNDPGESP